MQTHYHTIIAGPLAGQAMVILPWSEPSPVTLPQPKRPMRVIRNVADVPEAFIIGGRA